MDFSKSVTKFFLFVILKTDAKKKKSIKIIWITVKLLLPVNS